MSSTAAAAATESSGGSDADATFVLHLAFAADATSTHAATARQRASPGKIHTSPEAAYPLATPTAAIAAATPISNAASAHLSPFGFITFPLTGGGPVLRSSQYTLAHVRAALPTHFPPAHVSQLVTAGVLSTTAARALLSAHFFFLCAGGGASGAPPGASFLPVSPVQEEHVLARNCCPVLVLKSLAPPPTPKPPTHHLAKEASTHMLGNNGGASGVAGGAQNAAFLDTLPMAPVQGGRRMSFDMSSTMQRELMHQDSSALLNTGYSSPPIAARALGGRSITAPAVEEKRDLGPRGASHGGHDAATAGLAMSPKVRALSGNGSEVPYRPIADAWPVHFDDVIREKSAMSLLHGGVLPSARPMSMRITVTGELLDKQPRNDSRVKRDSPFPPRATPPRRNASTISRGSANDEEDEREGSVKVFGNMHDFLADEERRRAKYDAAAAAWEAQQQAKAAEEEAARSLDGSPAASPRSGGSSGSSGFPKSSASASAASSPRDPSSSPSYREPLAQTPLWISLEDGSDEVVELIGRYFGLHPLTIEDCQSKGIREKLEVFPEYLFLVFHALDSEGESDGGGRGRGGASSRHIRGEPSALGTLESDVMRTTPLKLVVFPSLVLSFHKGFLPAVSVVRKQLDKLYRNRVLNTAWLIHGLLDVVSDSLMPVVDVACSEADAMEDLIYVINPGRQSHKDVLRRMGAIARRLTFLRQRLWSKRDILTSLIEKDWQFFLTGVKVPYLRDIYDHLVIMLHKLDAAIEVIVTLQSTYLAVVSIDVAAVSNDGNKAMKTLSAAATILLPLSLIASLMGMNVMVPFQFDAEKITFMDLMPFSVICICMLFISTTLYSYFKKQRYL